MIKDDYTLQLFCEKNDVEFTVENQPELGKKIYIMRRPNGAFESIRSIDFELADALHEGVVSFNIMVRGMLKELKEHENEEIGG